MTDPSPSSALPEPPAFDPVPCTHRHDGWTADRQRRFVAALVAIGGVAKACRAVGMSAKSAYKLHRRADAASFAGAWDTALAMGANRIYHAAVNRAVNGYTRPMTYRGKVVAQRHCYDNRTVSALDGRGGW